MILAISGVIIPGMSWHEVLNLENRIVQGEVLPLIDFGMKKDRSFSTPVILAEGPFDISVIGIIPSDKTTVRTPELDRYVDDVWNNLTIKEGKSIYNNDKVLVLGVTAGKNKL